MRLDTMLAASTATPAPTSSTAPNDSSDPLALNGTSSARSHSNANANVKLDLDLDLEISSAAERQIAESVSQELDYWEKLVFSFDMERDPGRPGQQPDAGSSSRTRGKRRTEEAQASGASSFIPGSAPSSSNAGQLHQQPSGTRQTHNPQFPPIATNPIVPGQQPSFQGQQFNQLPGLDPYTLAHLAALSALQQGQQGPGQQGQQSSNVQDPAAVLRQLQSLMYPYGHTGHTSPGGGSPMQGITQNSPQLQRFPSGSFNTPGTQQQQLHPMQPSLSESSGQQQRWPPQVPGIGNLPFPMPPIDPALANQLSLLSRSFLQNTYAQQPSQIQTPGAGPSMGGMRARSRSTTSSGDPSTPVSPSSSRGQASVDDAAMSEDKRRRNTLASARFRIKKKHKTLSLERSVVELEARADDLEREASELRRENGWLKEMLIMKGRSVRAQAVAVKAALDEAEEEEEEEEGEEASGEDGEDENNDGEKDLQDEPDIKGKGKGKAT
ncbi:hypothetical protein ACEPAI_1153 [Sanghuangporus weigelae]